MVWCPKPRGGQANWDRVWSRAGLLQDQAKRAGSLYSKLHWDKSKGPQCPMEEVVTMFFQSLWYFSAETSHSSPSLGFPLNCKPLVNCSCKDKRPLNRVSLQILTPFPSRVPYWWVWDLVSVDNLLSCVRSDHFFHMISSFILMSRGCVCEMCIQNNLRWLLIKGSLNIKL